MTFQGRFIPRPEISISSECARRARPPKFWRARQEKSVPGIRGYFTILLTTHVFSEALKRDRDSTSEITTTFLFNECFDALSKKIRLG